MRLKAGKPIYRLHSGTQSVLMVLVRIGSCWYSMNYVTQEQIRFVKKYKGYPNYFTVNIDNYGDKQSVQIFPTPTKAWQCKIEILKKHIL